MFASSLADTHAVDEGKSIDVMFEPSSTVGARGNVSNSGLVEIEVPYVDIEEGGLLVHRGGPLVLHATQSGDNPWYVAEIPGFDVPVAAHTLADIIESVNDLLAVLWEQYANEDDRNLTPRARSIKSRLLQEFEVYGRCS